MLKKLTLVFSDPNVEGEYRALKTQTAVKDYFITLYFLIFYIGATGIPEAISERWTAFYISLGSVLALILIGVCFKFFKWMKCYASLLTLLVMYTFSFLRFWYFTAAFNQTSRGLVYLRGYAFASLEIALCIRILGFGQRVFAVVLAFVLKFAVIGVFDTAILTVDIFLRLIALDGFTLFALYSMEKREKEVFSSFYKYREGLTKFKELLSNYLPQSVIVLDETVSQTLFSNKHFAELFGEPQLNLEVKPLSAESAQIPKVLMEDLEIDLSTLREVDTQNLFQSFHERNPVLKDVIRILNKENVLKDQAWTFCANYLNDHHKLFEIMLKKIKWDGHDAIAVIFNDITYQENLIALKVADANKDKILATVSHDLRTPLNFIINMLQLCEKKVTEPEVSEYLSLCQDNAYLLLSLVNSLLDLQQIAKGKLKINPSKVKTVKIFSDVMKLFQFQAKQNNISLDLHMSPNLPIKLETDENRLKQILINLIGNAFKFTFKGGITINVEEDREDERFIIMSVSDTGIGIREEDKDKLFKMFGKLEDKEGVNKNGIGLGLTIANALSFALSGGQDGQGIALESKYGFGCKFTFKILKTYSAPSNLEEKSGLRNRQNRCSTKTDNSSHHAEPKIEMKTASFDHLEPEIKIKVDSFDDLDELKPIDDIPSKLENHVFSPENAQEKNAKTIDESVYSGFLLGRKPSSSHSWPSKLTVFKSDNKIKVENGHPEMKHIFETTQQSERVKLKNLNPENRILVVDDNAFNLLVVENLLKELNFTIHKARSGQEAIDLTISAQKNQKPYPLILMDCQMPIMDGYETTKILKEMMEKKEIDTVPIVALTANTSQRDIERCFECGMVDYLSKPLQVNHLEEIIKKFRL